jgi:hypothetical protein
MLVVKLADPVVVLARAGTLLFLLVAGLLSIVY